MADKSKLKAISIQIPVEQYIIIDRLTYLQRFASKGEILRTAIEWYCDKHDFEKKILGGKI